MNFDTRLAIVEEQQKRTATNSPTAGEWRYIGMIICLVSAISTAFGALIATAIMVISK
jgi:hypothetical protein